jgi:hypothetical protein
LKTFDEGHANNMMGIMLDPCFKSFRVVENSLGHGNAIWLATNYDARIVILLLMVYFQLLNLTTVNACIIVVVVDVGEDFEENMCGVGA